MGVQGLMKYVLDHQADCADFVDLVEEAKIHSGIKILIDLTTFEYCIRPWILDLIESSHRNTASSNKLLFKLLEEEFYIIDNYMSLFVKNLRAVNISLIWMINEEVAGDLAMIESKIPRRRQLRENKTEARAKFMTSLDTRRVDTNNFKNQTEGGFPMLILMQIEATLRRLGCEVIQCCHSDGSLFLVQRVLQDDAIYTVFNNDTDFMIFKNSRFIPYALFDIGNHLFSNLKQSIVAPLDRLHVGILSTEKLRIHLQLPDHEAIVEVCSLKGNGFTKHFMGEHKVLGKLGLKPKFPFKELSHIIRTYQRIENIPEIAEILSRCPDMAVALNDARRFYNSDRIISEPAESEHGQFLVNLVKDQVLPPDIINIYNGFYSRIVVGEHVRNPLRDIEALLVPLRKCIYRMLLCEPKIMKEFGQGPESVFDEFQVNTENVEVVHIRHINSEKTDENKKIFHYVMTHMERDDANNLKILRKQESFQNFYQAETSDAETPNFFNNHEPPIAIKMYILRYMLLLNWRRNLSITAQQFLALTAVAIQPAGDNTYHQLNICPDSTAVTIGNWFLDIYRHAAKYVARILYLHEDVPEPKDVFCGSQWIAFYACCDNNNRDADESAETMNGIRSHMKSILFNDLDVITDITRGYTDFDVHNAFAPINTHTPT